MNTVARASVKSYKLELLANVLITRSGPPATPVMTSAFRASALWTLILICHYAGVTQAGQDFAVSSMLPLFRTQTLEILHLWSSR